MHDDPTSELSPYGDHVAPQRSVLIEYEDSPRRGRRVVGVLAGIVILAGTLVGAYVLALEPLVDAGVISAPTAREPIALGETSNAASASFAQAAQTDDAVDDESGLDEQGDEVDEDGDEPLSTPVPETTEIFAARDPFQQLVPEPKEAPAGSTAPAPATPPATGTSTNPPTVTPANPAPAPPSATVGATRIRVMEVFTGEDGVERVRIEVNGQSFSVAEGETFAGRFRVLDITGQCTTILFGDSRFTLCAGEEIRK